MNEIIIMASTKNEAIEKAKSNYPAAYYVKPYRYSSKGNNFYLFYEEKNENVDLFEHYETLPEEVQAILDKYCTGDSTYEDCSKLVLELEAVGYTCGYGLDAEPYELRKIK